MAKAVQQEGLLPNDPPRAESLRSVDVEQLFREHNETLLRFLRGRLKSEADAHEAAQEAYVRLLQLRDADRPSFMRAYLFKIAANVATDLLRRRRAQIVPLGTDALEISEPPTQERAFSAREQLKIIEQGLGELPPACYEAFYLSRHHGWSAAEIARHLGVTDRMVRLYIIRALEHLEMALSRSERKGRIR